MKKQKEKLPTVQELKSKIPELDVYKLTPNARYLIIYKKPRIIILTEKDIRREVDGLIMALTGLGVIACGIILDNSENIAIIEMK